MSPQDLQRRRNRAENETLIISRSGEGFRVYSPVTPGKPYVVQLHDDETPNCTCPDFVSHQSDPEWRCKHVLAVMARMVPGAPASATAMPAGQAEQEAPEKMPARRKRTRSSNGAARMLLKRSVSPDGRIDSLSVEIDTHVDSIVEEEVRASAVRVMRLQDRIVEDFLDGRGAENDSPQPAATPTASVPTAAQPADGSIAAKLLDVAGMNGQWGRRLFINVQANGQRLRLFGNRKQLAEHLVAIGQPKLAERIDEGVRLDVACRVTTEPSADGRFTNIVSVLPPKALSKANGPQGRSRS